MRRSARLGTGILVIPLVWIFLSCGGDGSGGPPTPASIDAVGNTQLNGTVGEVLATALQVRVEGSDGSAFAGATVVWAVTAGGGSLSSTETTTDANGVATVTWTLGPIAGQQTVTATVAGLAVVTFTADAEPGAPDNLEVTPEQIDFMAIGASQALTVTVMDGLGNTIADPGETYETDDAGVATVSNSGLVTATGEGNTNITVSVAGLDEVVVPVSVEQVAASVSVTPDPINFNALGLSQQLTAQLLDGEGTPIAGAMFAFASDDGGVATVDAGGLVTAVANGNTTVRATSMGLEGTVDVTVQQVVDEVNVTPVDPAITVGGEVQLAAAVLDPQDNPVAGAVVAWTSDDETVATVDANGLVSGVAEGMATITATSGGVSGTTEVTVTLVLDAFEPMADQNLEGDQTFSDVDIPEGVTITATNDLTINAFGDVTINGTLTGDCVSIEINGQGNVTLGGDVSNDCSGAPDDSKDLIITGQGDLDIDDVSMESSGDVVVQNDPSFGTDPQSSIAAVAAAGARAHGEPHTCTYRNYRVGFMPLRAIGSGEEGRSIRVSCMGEANWFGGNSLQGQSGGHGDDDPIGGAPANDNQAQGDDGGDGGGVRIEALNGSLTFMDDGMGEGGPGTRIQTGDGGDGGDAFAEGQVPGEDAFAAGGDGGWGGGLGLQASGGDIIFQNVNSFRIVMGDAGDGGDAEAIGADGSMPSGFGGHAFADAGIGGSAADANMLAEGGTVQGTENIVQNTDPMEGPVGAGGKGGNATVEGGDGGDGDAGSLDGGDGGDMKANTGDATEQLGGGAPAGEPAVFPKFFGDGGDSFGIDIEGFTPLGPGGVGGDATFREGRGGFPFSDCVFPNFMSDAGDGGWGGDASGEAGNGGDGSDGTAADGTSTIEDGTGDGRDGGHATTSPGMRGFGGQDNVVDADNPNAFRDGVDGKTCEKKTFDVTLTVIDDPSNHDMYIQYSTLITSLMIWLTEEGMIYIDGPSPWVMMSGGWDPGSGVMSLTGSGSIPAMPPAPPSVSANLFFSGQIDLETWNVTGQLIVDIPGFGPPTTYGFSATPVPVGEQ